MPDAGTRPEKRWNGCRQRIAWCGLWVINIPASLLPLIRQFALVDRSDHCKVAAKDIPIPAKAARSNIPFAIRPPMPAHFGEDVTRRGVRGIAV
jgi:hypothetical protein